MDVRETVQKVLQEMVVPDLGRIREENTKILSLLDLTNKRLDDVNTHLADQSRRIDDLRSELTKRIDNVHSDLGRRIEETNQRIDDLRSELTKRIDNVHSDLIHRLDANNARIDLFFQSSVSKADQQKLEERVANIEHEVSIIKQSIAA